MSSYQVCSFRIHDLLEVDPARLMAAAGHDQSIPEWVKQQLLATPFVVVRRSVVTGRTIPVGVRGEERNQRWAASCHPAWVRRIITPPQLLQCTVRTSRAQAIPALHSLFLLKERWRDFVLPWGPGGSIGFELATAQPVANPKSDLDIVIYAENRIPRDQAKSLCAPAAEIPVALDIRVETPACGFSLKEYSTVGSNSVLLRMPSGGMLGCDPWHDDLRIADADQLVRKERPQR